MSRIYSKPLTKQMLLRFSKYPGLPRDTWYVVAGSALSTLNKPEQVGAILQFALHESAIATDTISESLRISRRMREAMIKLTAISGLPKTINSMLALKNVTPPQLLDEPLAKSPTLRPVQIYDVPSSRVLQQGQRFFDAIYGKISRRVMGQMDRSGTEDLGITARLMYGYILSNTMVLTPAETSFVLIAGLIPQDVNPQLKGHLKGAVNNGATVDEVRAVRGLVMEICKHHGMQLQRSDNTTTGIWQNEVADL